VDTLTPVDTTSPFLYKNVNPLTDDIATYTERMKGEGVSGNLDGPEGALEAMYQSIACRVSKNIKNLTSRMSKKFGKKPNFLSKIELLI